MTDQIANTKDQISLSFEQRLLDFIDRYNAFIMGVGETLPTSSITRGILPVEHGGLGTNTIHKDKLLFGNNVDEVASVDALDFNDERFFIGNRIVCPSNIECWGDATFRKSKVGINTNEPQHALHVNGIIFTSQNFISLSDARFKTNIRPLSSVQALQDTIRLQGVLYQSKDDDASGDQLGFIAQDVSRIRPELVHKIPSHEKSGDTTYALAYQNMTALHNESIKELYGYCQKLEKEIQTLKQKETRRQLEKRLL